MTDKAEIRDRIEAKVAHGEFLANLIFAARRDSANVQTTFIDDLTEIATRVRGVLEVNGLIKRVSYEPQAFWPDQRGCTFGFVDGGVANIELPTAAPLGIRVGSYVVKPGNDTEDREQFSIDLALVDDLYSPEGRTYDDDFEDVAKLRDAARIISEVSVAFRLATRPEGMDAVLLHGPLINPVAPYGLGDFPAFSLDACRKFLWDPPWGADEKSRNFVPLYRTVLEKAEAADAPVFGVVERSLGKNPAVTKALLQLLVDQSVLRNSDRVSIEENLKDYSLNDSNIFDVVLDEGEYTAPTSINRQGPESKWPNVWAEEIRKYPSALTTYLKPSDGVLPFRVEAFPGAAMALELGLGLILHTSRLLPTYGFPVGLDIVDKFAKVPAWLSKGVMGQHKVVLLKKALSTGDPKAISYAMRVLSAKGRDWLFRPTA